MKPTPSLWGRGGGGSEGDLTQGPRGWGRCWGSREGLADNKGRRPARLRRRNLPRSGVGPSSPARSHAPSQPGRLAHRLLPLSPRHSRDHSWAARPRPRPAPSQAAGRAASDGAAGCVANRHGPRGGGLGSAPPPASRANGALAPAAAAGVRGHEAPPRPPLSPLPRPFWPAPPPRPPPQSRAEAGAGPRAGPAPAPPAGPPARLTAPVSPPSFSLSLTPSAMAAAAAEQQQFYLLLGNLLSPDNVVRKQAEVTKRAAPRLSAPRVGAPTLPPDASSFLTVATGLLYRT